MEQQTSNQAKLEAAKAFLGDDYVFSPNYKFNPRHSPWTEKVVEENRKLHQEVSIVHLPTEEPLVVFDYVEKGSKKPAFELSKALGKEFIKVVFMVGYTVKEILAASKRGKLPVFRGLTHKQVKVLDKKQDHCYVCAW